MIDVSGYGDGEGDEFVLPDPPAAPSTPQKRKAVEPPVATNWRGDPVVPLLRQVGVPSGKPRRPWLLTTGAFLIAMPGTAVGIVLCLTVIGIPLGLPLMMLSCYPLRWVLDRHSEKLDAWYNRDRPLDEETVKPWETQP